MANRYAANTSVPVAKSRIDLETLLARHGAESFAFASEGGRSALMFRLSDRAIRFVLPLPDRDDPEFVFTETGRDRSEAQAEKAWEQACRSRWRSLLLVVKAKLEAIEAGISTVEQEFLAYVVTGSNRTIGEEIIPQIEAVACGRSPMALLTNAGGPDA